MRYAGHAKQWNDIIYYGEVSKQDFLVLYVQGGRIVAVVGTGSDAEMIYTTELLGQGQLPTPTGLGEEMAWVELVR